METRDLQIFLAVATTGSITRAAEMCGCSQPSVTRTVKDLEAELGFDLLHRVGRGVVLSEAGIAFEGEARRMLSAFTELAERAKSIASGKGRTLEIATTSAIGTGLIPAALASMGADRLPEVHLAHFLPTTVSQQVRSGQSEIGFSSLPLDGPGLDLLRLYSASDVAALHKDDPLAKLDVVPLEAFAGRRLVTMLDPMRFMRQVSRAMTERGVKPAGVMRTNVAYVALHLVQDTGAVAIIDPVTSFTVPMRDVVIRPIDVSLPFHWGAIALRGAPLRPLATELVEAVERMALLKIPDLEILDPARAGHIITQSSARSGADKNGTTP